MQKPSIKERSFKSFLDLFLICTYIDDKSLNSANLENFKLFDYKHSRIPEALGAYQLAKDSDQFCGAPVSELDMAVEKWESANKIEYFKKVFNENRIIDEACFKDFYGDDDFDRHCYFCNIKESDIQNLYEAKQLLTKRLSTRGFRMEVDRLSPNEGYVNDNIALCCYWCNNAKTDEFSAKEFKPIGELIGQTLRDRLKQ